MFSRPTNPVSHRLARFAFFLACAAALTVAACGPAHRFLGIDLDLVLIVFRYGFYAATAAIALGLATVVPTRPGERRRGFVAAVLALVIGVAAAWSPAQWLLQARAAPRINDVTTDPARPPAMVVTLQMRKGAANPAAYPGESAAAQQRTAYPDIVPIVLAVPPAEAFKRVDRVAMALGWEVVARAPPEGRLEAVDTTDWFGLQDDIVVRIRTEGTTGSRVDIRSKSRLGESDFGANARRIRAFAEQLRAEQ
ncbi:DUF1499 domain-containing protein [Reyranella sp.]|uniref:DUF1499 domain-containing protein n=1 Tax=Reyranella sp. TaxID=1929291 RepID=UPI003D143CCC